MYQLTRDGVSLRFEDVGKGAPPLVLIHDLACDHTSFAPQIQHFRPGHRVVAVDLRGHGLSHKPGQPYTVAGFADDVAWLCYELGVYAPVILGHGLGGMVAVDLAARYPDIPAAIVALNSPILPPPGSQQTAASAWESILAWDGAAAAAACRAPVLYVDAGTRAADLDRFRELCPHLTVASIRRSGHFAHLERSDQVNGLIERFMDSLNMDSLNMETQTPETETPRSRR